MGTRCVILGLFSCMGTGVVWAAGQTERAADPAKPEIFVGAGALIASEPYRGMAARVYPIPLFGYEGQRLYIRGISGGYRLIQGEGWSLGPVFHPRFEGYRSEDSSALAGMEDRRITLDTGVGFSWRTSLGLLSTSWVTDVLGRHKGYETEFVYTLLFPCSGFDVIPSLGIRCKSGQLTNYYYGVQPDEALPGRSAYKAGSAVDPFIRLAMKRGLTDKLSVLGAVQYEWFDKEIRDSPIVDRAYSISFLLGILYTL